MPSTPYERPELDRIGRTGVVAMVAGLFGVGFERYASAAGREDPLLELLSVFGVWSFVAVLVLLAAVPTANHRDPWYSVGIAFGFAAAATYATGWPYALSTPTPVEKLWAALFVGLVAVLLVGLPAVGLGLCWRRLRGHLQSGDGGTVE
ncbi:hypothetical protein [Haloarchaeobius salinus]|uniref:hypothetical protein n=1 Tax=Haloarchaeobius salinus TaxID=1198298 RepID=UPI00210E337A|nr:hypothetical protein [Haloarchaeobius salinus]